MNQNCVECELDYKTELSKAAQQIQSLTKERDELQARNEELVEVLKDIGAATSYQHAWSMAKQALSNNPDVKGYQLRDAVVEASIDHEIGEYCESKNNTRD